MRRIIPVCAAILAASCGRSQPRATPGAARAPASGSALALLERDLDLPPIAANAIRRDQEPLSVPVEANTDVVVTVTTQAFDPVLEVVPPGAEAMHNDDYQGSRNRSQLTIHTTQAGQLRLAVSSFGLGSGRYHVSVRKVPNQAASTFLTVGSNATGEVAPGDTTLADGRQYDQYMLLGPAAGGTYEVRLTARGDAVPLAVVLDPRGASIAATSPGVYVVREPFLHRIQLIAPAPNQRAGYSVALVNGGSPAAAPTANGAGSVGGAPTAAVARDSHALPAGLSGQAITANSNVNGNLGQGGIRLPTGESADVYDVDVGNDGDLVIDVQSDAFDTYLMVIGPDGRLQENDDATGTNSHLSASFGTAGRAHIVVTSYRGGESGAYQLKLGTSGASGASAAAEPAGANEAGATQTSGDEQRGELASGDHTLNSGEFVDNYRRQFTRGESVSIRLASDDFDPYLIVRSPSGRQLDNDDFAPPDRAAGIDIPAAEEGDYSIAVTSYQANEAGSYRLRMSSGAGTAPRGTDPSDNDVVAGNDVGPGNSRPASNQGNSGAGRLFGIFVGISDYPEGVGDLEECANDAIKLAETLRGRGLLTADRQVVLTDSQATTGAVRAAFQRLSTQIGPNDTFIFFHSGHGSQNEGSHDAREIDGTDESIYLYDGELIDDEMGTLFDGVRAHTSILALDSCFAGGFAKDVITRPGRVGFFSSEEDVESSVASEFQAGGYLSYFLRTGVQGEADNGPSDGALTVGELEHFLTVQFGRHATDVEMAGAYQHLVVDRGAVRSTEVLWHYR